MTKTKAFNTQCTLKTIFLALNRKVYSVKIKFLRGLSKLSMNSLHKSCLFSVTSQVPYMISLDYGEVV
jgi:hypothetical protein